jgi:hypothetical protein
VLASNAALPSFVSAAAPVLNLVVVECVPTDQRECRFGPLDHCQRDGWLAGLLAGAIWTG